MDINTLQKANKLNDIIRETTFLINKVQRSDALESIIFKDSCNNVYEVGEYLNFDSIKKFILNELEHTRIKSQEEFNEL